MSEVLRQLSNSVDPIDRELARILRIYQDTRAARGKTRSLGYEPRDIRNLGSVEVILRRVRASASGFDDVGPQDSYEALVLQFQTAFPADVVATARQRMEEEDEASAPTADPLELEERTARLLKRQSLPVPTGIDAPRTQTVQGSRFLRDPKVKAYVLRIANGRCEACDAPAPFQTANGLDYLEVHHVRPLACGGSDKVQNAVALCPNCHRACHLSANAIEFTARICSRISRIVPE